MIANFKKIKYFFSLLLILGITFTPLLADSANIVLDETFDTGVSYFQSGFNQNVYSVIPLVDGDLLVGGEFTAYDGRDLNRIARLNQDGSLDEDFLSLMPGFDSPVYRIVSYGDKFIVAGDFNSYFNNQDSYSDLRGIARLNSDLTLDETFSFRLEGGGVSHQSLNVQSDGKILLNAYFETYDQESINCSGIFRLDLDGSLDESFENCNGLEGGNILVQGDDKFFSSRSHLTRLNSDGSLDESYNSGSSSDIRVLHQYDDGKILISKVSEHYTIQGDDPVLTGNLLRLNSDGTIDEGFDTLSSLPPSFDYCTQILSLVVLDNGKIIVTGCLHYPDMNRNMIRLNPDGSLDESFFPDADLALSEAIISANFLPSGDIFLVGYFTPPIKYVVTIDQNGQIQKLFGKQVGFDRYSNHPEIISVAKDSQGKYLVIGYFNSYKGVSVGNIVRLNQDGSLDESFVTGTGFNEPPYKVEIDPNGKIIVVGRFSEYNGTLVGNIVRINPDGSLDNSFDNDNSLNGFINEFLFLPDGKIMIAGDLYEYGGISVGRIARLNPDWTVDETFNADVNNAVLSYQVLSDGKIIVVGVFDRVSNIPYNKIARLNPDGSLDATFDPGLGVYSGEPYKIKSLSDGNFLIFGQINEYGRDQVGSIIRLFPDGSLDKSFNTENHRFHGDLRNFYVQDSGKIILLTVVEHEGHGAVNSFIRLNSDGTIDETFEMGELRLFDFGEQGGSASLGSIIYDNKILGIGYFNNYEGKNVGYMARFSIPLSTYSLNYISTQGGSVGGDSSQEILEGENGSTVTAVADSGYRFVKWSDERKDNPRQDINVFSDVNVSAIFEKITGSSGGGSVGGGGGAISPPPPVVLEEEKGGNFVSDEQFLLLLSILGFNLPTSPTPLPTPSSDCMSFVLRQGDRGECVKYLQERLLDKRYSPGIVDGIFGVMTKSAVSSFQKSMNFMVDGIVGKQTWAGLK